MQKLYLLLFSIICSFAANAQLAQGSIAFTGFNTDGDDDFAIVALVDIPASQTIYFTDNDTDGSGGLTTGEGIIQWDTPASIVFAGTVITFTDVDNAANPLFGASLGVLSESVSGLNLSNAGDALLAYMGTPTTPSIFLAGIQNDENGDGGNLANTGLVEGDTFVTIADQGSHGASPDGGNYTGAISGETGFANYLTLINDHANWNSTNDGESLLLFDTTAFTATVSGTCDILFLSENYICGSNVIGAGNDSGIINIPFSGDDMVSLAPLITFNLTPVSAIASISTDFPPSSPVTGAIQITGVSEGDSWSLQITNGDCNGLTISGSVSSVFCDPTPAAGSIIINEFMQDPNGTDTLGEWFEVFNTSGTPIDMINWVVSDAGSDSFTITSSLVVPANGYAILGVNNDTATNGGVNVDYDYPISFGLSNSDDEIILTDGGVEIDRVAYNGTFPLASGKSTSLKIASQDASSNDTGSNWDNSITSYGAGGLGTPGAANEATLSTTVVEIEGFKLYPNPVFDGSFEISTRNNGYKQVSILNSIGITVYEGEIAPYDQVDVSNLLPGIYFVRIIEEGRVAVKKLIIK